MYVITHLPLSLCVSGIVIDIVNSFKLLGINIFDNLHVEALCAKFASRLYLLKILKRSGLPQKSCFVSVTPSYAQSLNTAVLYDTTI